MSTAHTDQKQAVCGCDLTIFSSVYVDTEQTPQVRIDRVTIDWPCHRHGAA
jgi:hypothetical protein